MNQKQDYIAVFDSGVGGISVLRHLRELMPKEKFLYFGDSANAPYGDRPTEEIRHLALQAAEKLCSYGIKALVVACNTATAAAIEDLRSTYPELIVVGIEPALKLAAEKFPGGTVGVLATPVTLREEKFQKLVKTSSNRCTVVNLSASGLADLIECGKANSRESHELLAPLLSPWANKLDALVLGCTHYPFAAPTISAILGGRVPLLDGGKGTAKETLRRLQAADLLWDGPGELRWESSQNLSETVHLYKNLLETEDFSNL